MVDEDSYVEGMDKIIQRDFFPDLPKLKLGLEYMEALETDDVRKQREIELKLQEAAAKKLETPTTCGVYSCAVFVSFHSSEDQQPTEAKAAVDTNLNLDKYLGKYNSEDNADFEKLTAKAETRRRNRAQWLEETARQNEALLQIASGHDSVQLLTWKYEPKNQLFYTPPTVNQIVTPNFIDSVRLYRQLKNLRMWQEALQKKLCMLTLELLGKCITVPQTPKKYRYLVICLIYGRQPNRLFMTC